MKKITLLGIFLFSSSLVFGQARPSDKFAWTQDAGSLTTVQSYRYELELDAVIQATALVTTCTGTDSPFNCSAPIPAVTPSNHSVRIRAVDVSGSSPLVGDWSDVFTFVMKAIPSKPAGIKIIPGN